MGTHFFTSITANFLPKARVLTESIRKFHPSAPVHVVLCDQVPTWFTLESEPFQHLLTLEDLGLPNLTSWLFQHDLVELCTAVKGFALQLILARDDCDQVIYLDPDILVLASFDGLLTNFEAASILLTTHQSEPETTYENVRDNELLTLQHGIFNLGFLGVKNSPVGHRFAAWWAERLRDFCFDDIPIGLFTDQRWPDLIPSFFPDHKVLRDAIYNVSGWNLTQRRVEGSLAAGFTVNGQPLVFYHFSGLDSGREWTMLQRWGRQMPALLELRDWYLAECTQHGDDILSSVPWAYGFFANGDPILRSQRVLYRHNLGLQARFPDPFHSFPLQIAPTALAEIADSEAPVRPYRIFLIAAPPDEQYIDETLAILRTTTLLQDQLWLVTPSLSRDVQSIAVDASRYEDFAAHVLEHFADKDIILIRAGALTPPQWDLRLAWTAARHPSALTISPLDRRVLDEAGLFSALDQAALDCLCYFYRQREQPEIFFFSQDCVYINSAGLRDLASHRKQLRLSHLLDDAARQRWQHLQATHLCLSFRSPANTTAFPMVASTEQTFLPLLRNALRNHAQAPDFYVPRRITSALTGATLHIAHSWGGGAEQWLRSFAQADLDHEQLVLRAVGPRGMFGRQLELHRFGANGLELLQTWTLAPGIRATALAHAAYRKILSELTASLAVARIIVSSLIGHSLDVLRTGLPTVFVCHDYYPFCSAIYLTFGEVCHSCEEPRLAACLEENPLNHHFPNVVKSEWLALRAEFLIAVKQNGTILVAPSISVQANYLRLVPELANSFHVIKHGLRHFDCADSSIDSLDLRSPQRLLRVLVLGSLVPHKGVSLLAAMLDELTSFAELTLAGCLETGARFSENPKIRVIPEYQQEELSHLVATIQPDLGLLLSTWPETFSYTLHELQSLCVPPLATNLGGFRDAIEEGVTGFLCPPEPQSILHRLRHLASSPNELDVVRGNLALTPRRTLATMVEDYAALTPDAYTAARYFSGPQAPATFPQHAVQLYWCESGQQFAEHNSFSVAPFHLGRQTARLYIPALRKPIGKLRFDPGASPGMVEITALVLCRKTGDVLWSSSNCRTLLTVAYHANVFALSDTTLCVTADDPQIHLPLSEEVLAQLSNGGYLDVRFACNSLESHLHELISEPAALSHQLTQTQGHVKHIEAALAQTKQNLVAKTQDLEQAAQRLAVSTQDLEQTKATLTMTLQQTQDTLTLTEEHFEETRETLLQVEEHLEQMAAALAESEAQISSRTHELALTRQHSENLEGLHRTLVSSLSWQLTKPVRLVGELGRKLSGHR